MPTPARRHYAGAACHTVLMAWEDQGGAASDSGRSENTWSLGASLFDEESASGRTEDWSGDGRRSGRHEDWARYWGRRQWGGRRNRRTPTATESGRFAGFRRRSGRGRCAGGVRRRRAILR